MEIVAALCAVAGAMVGFGFGWFKGVQWCVTHPKEVAETLRKLAEDADG